MFASILFVIYLMSYFLMVNICIQLEIQNQFVKLHKNVKYKREIGYEKYIRLSYYKCNA